MSIAERASYLSNAADGLAIICCIFATIALSIYVHTTVRFITRNCINVAVSQWTPAQVAAGRIAALTRSLQIACVAVIIALILTFMVGSSSIIGKYIANIAIRGTMIMIASWCCITIRPTHHHRVHDSGTAGIPGGRGINGGTSGGVTASPPVSPQSPLVIISDHKLTPTPGVASSSAGIGIGIGHGGNNTHK
jgi:hypothetical protein